jgi:hypothetical protein
VRAGAFAVIAASCLCAAGAIWVAWPFEAPVRSWIAALIIALAGAYLLYQGIVTLSAGQRSQRTAALAAFGGALAAAAMLQAAFVAGQPARIPGVPGQLYRISARSSVAVEFPAALRSQGVWITSGRARIAAHIGQTVRQGPFVFRVVGGPIARVIATSPNGKNVTVTQPQGAAFASPFLLFASTSDGQPADLFAVPALHRVVRVAYYPGLPSHNINIPFLLVQINEENGGVLYQGVVVSGRPARHAGITLNFEISTYPVVLLASAPAMLPFALALALTLAGLIGYAWSTLTRGANESSG